MIGIYQDNFVDYLREHLGTVKITAKNIITICPFCIEHHKGKEHLHLYIALDAPIFNCFQAGCRGKGILKRLIQKIEGHDISDKFIDKTKIVVKKPKINVNLDKEFSKIKIPELKTSLFKCKELYIKSRLKFHNIRLEEIKGLVFDINKFIDENKIPVDEKLFRLRDYLQANFVGFLTENKATMILRNIDEKSDFKHFKIKCFKTPFLDYYKLQGLNKQSNTIVLSEGLFNIFTEQIFDTTNNKEKINLYAAAHSSFYNSLLQSIVFNEQIFRPDVIILSDQGIDLKYYKNFKKYNSYLINSLIVYYNLLGKDFNENIVKHTKFVI